MRSPGLALLLSGSLLAGPAIFLERIDRAGLPPYVGEQGKLYILQGDGCETLRKGNRVELRRPGKGIRTGKLAITQAADHSAVGELVEAGTHFPMKGDEATLLAEEPPPQAHTPVAAPAQAEPQNSGRQPRRPRPGRASHAMPPPRPMAPGGPGRPASAATPHRTATKPSIKIAP